MNHKHLLFLIGLVLLVIPGQVDAARLWSTGYENQSAGTFTFGYEGFDSQSGTASDCTIDTTTKRSGASSLRITGATGCSTDKFITTTSGDVYIRFYLRIAALASGNIRIFYVWDQGIDAQEGRLNLEADGQLHWADDESAIDGQGTTVLNLNQWYRIEINYDADDQVLVYLDGKLEIDSGTHTGDNIDAFVVGDQTDIADYYIDDVAFNDTTVGGNQTGFPGAGSIVYMRPDASGDNNGCSAGDYDSVNEVQPDDASTICVLDLDAGNDTLDVNVETPTSAGISDSSIITLVQAGVREAGVSAASHTWNARVKSAASGTVNSGSAFSNSLSSYNTNYNGSIRNYSVTAYVDPTTGVDWTQTGTNSLTNMQIGVNVTDGNPDVNVTQVWALVEFCDPTIENKGECERVFDTAGYTTWTVPPGVTSIDVACWGGGGGGATGATNSGGGGGGGGAFASTTQTVAGGDVIRIQVGAAVALEVNGATSTASTTAPAFIVEAQGGRGVAADLGAAGGLAASSRGTTKKDGGSGGGATTGTGDESGGGGGGAGLSGIGGNGGVCTSTTVGCGGGGGNGGGNGGTNAVTAGTAGFNAGAGGTGDDGTTAATVGANGTYGGGGGGGADDGRAGANGGSPGGGGGGGEGGGGGGARGQCLIVIREPAAAPASTERQSIYFFE